MGALAGETGGSMQGEMAETETELGVRGRKAAALAIGKAVVTAGWLGVDGDFGADDSAGGAFGAGVHGFLSGCTGYPPGNLHEYQNKGVAEKHFVID